MGLVGVASDTAETKRRAEGHGPAETSRRAWSILGEAAEALVFLNTRCRSQVPSKWRANGCALVLKRSLHWSKRPGQTTWLVPDHRGVEYCNKSKAHGDHRMPQDSSARVTLAC